MAKIRIRIDKNGNPTILDVTGAGQHCAGVTANFEKMLGQAAEESRALTDSFYSEDEKEYNEELTNDPA